MPEASSATVRILGIRFFNGSVVEAVAHMAQSGGLLVAPSGTCFHRLQEDIEYRRAVTTADVALADSGLMVLLWRLVRRQRVERISGLTYLQELIRNPTSEIRNSLWVLPHMRARDRLLGWAGGHEMPIDPEACYVAPIYGRAVEDPNLLALVDQRQPNHVIIGIGAGPQEKLGWYLREHSSSRPAIHCIGGALGFVTGDQVAIPAWADRLYLGWLFRLVTQPDVFIPRLWKGRVLPMMVARYGSELPGLEGNAETLKR